MTNTTAAGSRWRRAVQVFLADHGIESTFRPWMDSGDDVQTTNTDPALSIEAKNAKSIPLAAFMDQAVTQHRAPGSLPIVIAKRRGRPVADAYVILRLSDLPGLLATSPERAAP